MRLSFEKNFSRIYGNYTEKINTHRRELGGEQEKRPIPILLSLWLMGKN